MKLSIALISASTVFASPFAAANTLRVSGAPESFDEKAKTISKVKSNSGELMTYKYAKDADLEALTAAI